MPIHDIRYTLPVKVPQQQQQKMGEFDELNVAIGEFLVECYAEMGDAKVDTEDLFAEWVFDVFFQRTLNQWEDSFDVAENIDLARYVKKNDALCNMIKYIHNYYMSNFGESYLPIEYYYLDIEELSEDLILRHYAYAYAFGELGPEGVQKLLGLKVTPKKKQPKSQIVVRKNVKMLNKSMENATLDK